jgi:putative proteasome-type protease
MTYCVGLRLRDGLVMLSDTRTNAGVDNIATFTKMHVIDVPGERTFCLLTAGNLAVTQAVVHRVADRDGGDPSKDVDTLYTVPTMFRAAELIGKAIREQYDFLNDAMKQQNFGFDASMLLGGQIKGQEMRLYQIYAAGNFIEATTDTPYLQIGEHKYGKPILDRAASYDTPLDGGIKLALVSMDSTLRSNLTVGLPMDLFAYKRDSLKTDLRRRITEDDKYFRQLREHWSVALREAYRAFPPPDWT